MAEPSAPSNHAYLWVARVVLPSTKVRVLERELRGLRHELHARDVSALGDPEFDTDIELWAHPDDQGPAARILGHLVAKDSP